MKTSTSTLPLRARWRAFTAAITASAALAISTASADLVNYRFVYSGAALGNGATAEGIFTVDDTVFTNPGSFTIFGGGISGAIVDVTMTVSGASSGNGTFTAADFGNGYYFTISDALDLNTEWVGQPQPTTSTTWGDYTLGGSDSNDLNFFGTSAGAPSGSFFFQLTADGGAAETMVLVSVLPATPNPGELTGGEAVSNAPGATVSALKPAAIADSGKLFLRSKIKGTGVTSTNAYCLLSWDPLYSVARTVVRAGDLLYGNPIKTFGDPDASGSGLLFKASLTIAGAVTKDNNDAIALVGQNGSASSLIGLLREGDDASIGGGFHFTKFDWFHGVTLAELPPAGKPGAGAGISIIGGSSSGAFIGAQIADATGAVKGQGCWFSDGFSVTPIVYSGGSVVIDGVTKTVKTVSKPTVSSPAQAQTRVGNSTTISLLIKTIDNMTAIKTFEAPSASARPAAVALPHGPYGPRKQ